MEKNPPLQKKTPRMSFLLELPVEILYYIFMGWSSPRDVWSLLLTCRWFHEIFIDDDGAMTLMIRGHPLVDEERVSRSNWREALRQLECFLHAEPMCCFPGGYVPDKVLLNFPTPYVLDREGLMAEERHRMQTVIVQARRGNFGFQGMFMEQEMDLRKDLMMMNLVGFDMNDISAKICAMPHEWTHDACNVLEMVKNWTFWKAVVPVLAKNCTRLDIEETSKVCLCSRNIDFLLPILHRLVQDTISRGTVNAFFGNELAGTHRIRMERGDLMETLVKSSDGIKFLWIKLVCMDEGACGFWFTHRFIHSLSTKLQTFMVSHAPKNIRLNLALETQNMNLIEMCRGVGTEDLMGYRFEGGFLPAMDFGGDLSNLRKEWAI